VINIYICTAVYIQYNLLVHSMESLDIMFKTGLYINDLSMHDSSRDLVLAGTQQSAELKLALDQVRYPFLLYWYARYVCVYAVFTCSPAKVHAHTFIVRRFNNVQVRKSSKH